MIEQTLRAVLTTEQKRGWREGDWGADMRKSNERVACAFIQMLEEGVDVALLKNTGKLIDELDRRAVVQWDEIAPDEGYVDNIISGVVKKLLKGKIPTVEYDYRDDSVVPEPDDDDDDRLSDEEWSEMNPYYDDEDDE